MAIDSEGLLLKDYETTFRSIEEGADSQVWMEALFPLVNRTLELLKERTGKVDAQEEWFSVNDLVERFATEDIEVFAKITVAMVHGNVDTQGIEHDEPLLNTSMLGLHFEDNDTADMIQLEDNLSLLEMAAKFDIDPDMKVWQVGDPG